jgi:hypothetical protein
MQKRSADLTGRTHSAQERWTIHGRNRLVNDWKHEPEGGNLATRAATRLSGWILVCLPGNYPGQREKWQYQCFAQNEEPEGKHGFQAKAKPVPGAVPDHRPTLQLGAT